VKIYIHDSSKDIFYELENLNEIKDRTILKLFETDGSGRGPSGQDGRQKKDNQSHGRRNFKDTNP
jgi:hypothetical protein